MELLRGVSAEAAAERGDPAGDEAARVQDAAELLRGLGGDVEVTDEDGDRAIHGFGCPLSGLVSQHVEACLLAEALVGEITGLPVTECCDRGERPRCAFRVGTAA